LISNGSSDPATGKEIGKVPDMGVEETREAIKHADVAFKSWTKTTAKARLPFFFLQNKHLTHVFV
jgi:acyl-CoA reductase-like NAD-dependent aldehyde dehydrogenase